MKPFHNLIVLREIHCINIVYFFIFIIVTKNISSAYAPLQIPETIRVSGPKGKSQDEEKCHGKENKYFLDLPDIFPDPGTDSRSP